jgi:hypothetical protein
MVKTARWLHLAGVMPEKGHKKRRSYNETV